MPSESFFQRRGLQNIALSLFILFYIAACASTQPKELQATFSAVSPAKMTFGAGTVCLLNKEPSEVESAALLKILPLLAAKDLKLGEEDCDVWVAVSFASYETEAVMTLDTHRDDRISSVSVKADRASWAHEKVILNELVESYGLNYSWELKCNVEGRVRCMRYIDEAGDSIIVPRAGMPRVVRPYYNPPGTGGPGQGVPEPIMPPRRY